MNNIAIFASGSGTNAQKIMEFFKDHPAIRISTILSNKKDAYVIERAKKFNVPVFIFSKDEFYEKKIVLDYLIQLKTDYIVLAGFLWLVPKLLIQEFPERIMNIHPALLPKYGGKGMYGMAVHQAVIENREKESGITIHYVNEKYDDGSIIFQAKCPVLPGDTPEMLAGKVHQLEYNHFPKVIESWILNKKSR
ncbi:MAG: phosphoribosylglycinamide formyltransferase [Bacteroidales bacterium]|nr:phosphoribosylglycinamide formyltransferase [Bacteroidales bacterium]